MDTHSQDSDEPAPSSSIGKNNPNKVNILPTPQLKKSKDGGTKKSQLKGVEKVTKLRAFSIQKKTTLSSSKVPTLPTTGNTTVVIGKLSSVKVTPKPAPVDDEQKKLPKPPKPGSGKKHLQASYSELQKQTLSEIEDMKRKMELVDLGIPLGLICPSTTFDKAMPSKAMPPIKTFLEASKVDELIREAKKARAEGKEFKFDYQKLLPDYDNPFQRKKDNEVQDNYKQPKEVEKIDIPKRNLDRDSRDRRRSERYESSSTRRTFDYRHDDRDKDKYKGRDKSKDKTKETDSRYDRNKNKDHMKEEDKILSKTGTEKETNVNLNDYLVCDSWSLDTEDKNSSSPIVADKTGKITKVNTSRKDDEIKDVDETQLVRQSFSKSQSVSKPVHSSILLDKKFEKLQPVRDTFKYEIDLNEDDVLDIHGGDCDLDNYTKTNNRRFDNASLNVSDIDGDLSKDNDSTNDETFLESVINEIKLEVMSDDGSQDKGLVEYDLSPKEETVEGSVTPELDDRMKEQSSRRSDYSDYRSIDSDYKSSESDYKSSERSSGYRSDSYRMSMEKDEFETKLSKSTVESLEMWSFVLKICQPILFRHDKNKCYKETHTKPPVWYAESPKLCSCVKDRAVVYNELEMCKMELVDQIYTSYQSSEHPVLAKRTWHPHADQFLVETPVQLANEWETEENQAVTKRNQGNDKRASMTPKQSEEISLDQEYQRFMDAVWPEISEKKPETSRSTTPVQESRKKKIEDDAEKEAEDKKKAKKMKLSSEGWSQESEMEEDIVKSKKAKEKEKRSRKRRHSTSNSTLSSVSDSEIDAKKKKKSMKKANKKVKSKELKHRKDKKTKKLREKSKKKRIKEESDKDEDKKKKLKRSKRKKQMKHKKKVQKKKVKVSSSSSSDSSTSFSSDSETSSDSELEMKKKNKKDSIRKKKKEKKKRKQSNENLFDVNILNNIKTERLTDDERNQKKNADQEFSPRRQQTKRPEIINVKELQDDFVENNIKIKQEIVEETQKTSETVESVDTSKLDDSKKTESQNEEIESMEKETERKIEETESKIEEMEGEIEETKSKIKEPESIIEETKSKIDETKSKIEEPKSKIDEMKSKIEEPKSKIDETNSIIDETNSKIEERKSKIDETKSKIEQIQAQKESEPASLEIHQVQEPISQPIQELVIEPSVPEKEEIDLKPSMDTLNYSYPEVNTFVSASESDHYAKHLQSNVDEEKFDGYEHGNYEMYEQLAMAYQSDAAAQAIAGSAAPCQESGVQQRIETVVCARRVGEIKCDWRASDTDTHAEGHQQATRPSRWGLKPGEVNIVLTGGNSDHYPPITAMEPVYQIESIANANRNDTSTDYDEAYMDMYGAADRLQYGDCFAEPPACFAEPPACAPAPEPRPIDRTPTSLDARIDMALKHTILGEVAKEPESMEDSKDVPDKRKVSTKSNRPAKRVSFADGYKPGQDSDVEEPPVKIKKVRARRTGTAWPCPATHPDHVPLWDALPPPPPPPGSPPPPRRAAPPTHLLRARRPRSQHGLLPHPPHPHPFIHKFDPNTPMPPIMPPEPPPRLVNF